MSPFTWDPQKEWVNLQKHGISFAEAAKAFKDPNRCIYLDTRHSGLEQRFFCIGKVDSRIMTVRFVYRDNAIRIFGAGYWRKGESYYEKEKK